MRIKVVALAVIACSAAIAACGGSSSSSTPSNSTTTPASTSSSSSSATSSSSSTASSGGATAGVAHCVALAGVGEKFASTLTGSLTGHLNVQRFAQDFHTLAAAAPGPIQQDVQTIADTFTTFANRLSQLGYKIGSIPSATQLIGLESALTSLKTAKVSQAEQHITAWVKSNCH